MTVDKTDAEYQFDRDLAHASALTGKDLAREDNVMARFMALTEVQRHNLVQVLNCYMWAAADLDVHARNILTTKDGNISYFAGVPGEGAGIFGLRYAPEMISPTTLWQLVRLDQGRTVHVKSNESLPQLPQHQRLIAATTITNKSDRRDFHFITRGSSGYWSHIRGRAVFPTFFDDANNLITDPRTACFTGQDETHRFLFFAVPEQGLPIKLDPEKIMKQHFNLMGQLCRSQEAHAPLVEREAHLETFMAFVQEHVPKPVILRKLEDNLRRTYLMD